MEPRFVVIHHTANSRTTYFVVDTKVPDGELAKIVDESDSLDYIKLAARTYNAYRKYW